MRRFWCFNLSTIALLIGWIGLIWSIADYFVVNIEFEINSSDEYTEINHSMSQYYPDFLKQIHSCKFIEK